MQLITFLSKDDEGNTTIYVKYIFLKIELILHFMFWFVIIWLYFLFWSQAAMLRIGSSDRRSWRRFIFRRYDYIWPLWTQTMSKNTRKGGRLRDRIIIQRHLKRISVLIWIRTAYAWIINFFCILFFIFFSNAHKNIEIKKYNSVGIYTKPATEWHWMNS